LTGEFAPLPPGISPRQTGRFYLLLGLAIAASAFIPILCGILYGFVGTDTNYHMGSWVDILREWHAGVLSPGWAAGANYGMGDPRFCFYPPIPMLLGSLALLLLPNSLAMGALLFLTFFAAGLCMYALARRFFDPTRSAAAAVLYTLSYFLLITALKHAALAELMVDAFLPLTLLFFLDVLYGNRRASAVYLALTLGATWVVDVPIAIETAYSLTLATLLVALARRQAGSLVKVLLAQAAGVLCAAFYLIPAFASQHLIYSSTRLEFKVRTLFSSHTLQDVTLSADALLLAAIIGVIFYQHRRQRAERPILVILLLGLIAFFFQLPISRLFWMHLPELRVVGFPHRFQVFLAIAFPLAILLKNRSRLLIGSAIGAYVLLALIPFYGFHQWVHRSGPLETANHIVERSQQGYAGAPEYVPRGTGALWMDTTNAFLVHNLPLVRSIGDSLPPPPVQLDPDNRSAAGAQLPTPGAPCDPAVQRWDPESRAVSVRQGPCRIDLRLYLFPFWHFTVDGKPVRADAGYLGTATLLVPPGQHLVTATFQQPRAPRLAGWAITLITLALLLGLCIRSTRATGNPSQISV
jgi:hypothetical protein